VLRAVSAGNCLTVRRPMGRRIGASRLTRTRLVPTAFVTSRNCTGPGVRRPESTIKALRIRDHKEPTSARETLRSVQWLSMSMGAHHGRPQEAAPAHDP